MIDVLNFLTKKTVKKITLFLNKIKTHKLIMYTNSVLMIYFWYYLTIIYRDLSKNDKYLNYLLIENKRIKLNWIPSKQREMICFMFEH